MKPLPTPECVDCIYETERTDYDLCLNCDEHASNFVAKVKNADDNLVKAYHEIGKQMNDAVKSPKHYMICDREAIDIIKKTLTTEEYKGYIKGSVLKYRLRAGKKDDTVQDIAKALTYEEMFEVEFN